MVSLFKRLSSYLSLLVRGITASRREAQLHVRSMPNAISKPRKRLVSQRGLSSPSIAPKKPRGKNRSPVFRPATRKG